MVRTKSYDPPFEYEWHFIGQKNPDDAQKQGASNGNGVSSGSGERSFLGKLASTVAGMVPSFQLSMETIQSSDEEALDGTHT